MNNLLYTYIIHVYIIYIQYNIRQLLKIEEFKKQLFIKKKNFIQLNHKLKVKQFNVIVDIAFPPQKSTMLN